MIVYYLVKLMQSCRRDEQKKNFFHDIFLFMPALFQVFGER